MAARKSSAAFHRVTLIAPAVACCFSVAAAFANPTGHRVVRGSATVVPNGNVLQITNAPNTIINWQRFAIAADEVTRFVQQSASSAVLNRVTTQNVSRIQGALESNGRVFLINRNGIVFGPQSQVDVAGLVASTLNLSNADFLAGRLRFAGGPGLVINEGEITTPPGGDVYLIGRGVINRGDITNPDGDLVLAAGRSIELVNPGTPNLRVEIAGNQPVNLQRIGADARRLGIFAGLNNQNTNANTAVATQDGRVVLRASNNVQAGTGAATTTSAGTGIANGGTATGTQNGTFLQTGVATGTSTGTNQLGTSGVRTLGTGTNATFTSTSPSTMGTSGATTFTNTGTGTTFGLTPLP